MKDIKLELARQYKDLSPSKLRQLISRASADYIKGFRHLFLGWDETRAHYVRIEVDKAISVEK